MWKVPRKKPKTKAYLPKTKGPTSNICWHSLSELLEFRIGLLEQGSHAFTISQCNSDLSGSEPSHPVSGPAQHMERSENTHRCVSISRCCESGVRSMLWCCILLSLRPFGSPPPPPPCAFYFMVSKRILYHILS